MATIASFPTIEQPTQDFPKASDPVVSLEKMDSMSSDGEIKAIIEDNMIYLSGLETKKYHTNLKSLGGIWNKGIKKWSFDKSHLKDIEDFLAGVKSGNIKPEPFIGYTNKKKPSGAFGSFGFPSSSGNLQADAGEFKLPVINKSDSHLSKAGPWTVFVPIIGMIAQIKVSGHVITRKVTKVSGDSSKGYEATVIADNGDASLLQITNGHWTVRGLMPNHYIHFDHK